MLIILLPRKYALYRIIAKGLLVIQNYFIVHCPKSNPNIRDTTRNVEENEKLHEIFSVVQYFVSTDTFRVISGKIEYLWDRTVYCNSTVDAISILVPNIQ